MNQLDILKRTTFGHRVAEEETVPLSSYFVETDHWRRLFQGDIDVVYGPKGSGKSALYSLLQTRNNELFDRNVILLAGENPRGATAFRGLATDPPASEREFVGLWKLYIASLLHSALSEYGISNAETDELGRTLEREGLVKATRTLGSILAAVGDYARRFFRPEALEGGVEVDPLTLLPKGFTGKIVFGEPGRNDESGLSSVDHLLGLASRAFTKAGMHAWILLDRLDVAFAENGELEGNALRALFRAYLDLMPFENLKLKIFLRTDIWDRITRSGFREASHITRHATIEWSKNSLLNLVVRRILHNDAIRHGYSISIAPSALTINQQEEFFYRLFPQQVDVGEKKPRTLDWILTRTCDGTKANAPRELIHFLNCLRDVEVRRLEIGEAVPDGEQLFANLSFKRALPEVSKTRLEQTLYAEYPEEKSAVERLHSQKTSQTPSSLSVIWNVTVEEAIKTANRLITIGFFESRGTKESPEYWVPFLYRDALEMVQGAAE